MRCLQIQTEVDLAVSSVIKEGELCMKCFYLDRKYIVTCWAAIDFYSHRDPLIPTLRDKSNKSGARHWE